MRLQLTVRAATALAVALALSGVWAAVAEASDQLGYVTSEQAGTIRQVDVATGAVGAPIAVGAQPVALAITPDGSTAFVADYGSSQIVPVTLDSGSPGTPISLPSRPTAIAISPNGKTAYIISDTGFEWSVTLSNDRLSNPSQIPINSDALALTPPAGTSGYSGYITNVADGQLIPFTVNSTSGQWTPASPIALTASTPDGVAITPDGSTAWVASNSGGTITPVTLASGANGTQIAVGPQPTSIALTPDGTTAYVTNFSTGQVTPVTLPTSTTAASVGTPITVGAQPSAIALVPGGGITAPPPGAYGGTGSGGSGGNGGGAVTTLGNQQLTLTLSGTGAASCHASQTSLAVTLKRKTLGHGAKLKLRYVTFKLGNVSKRVKRLPATVKFPLKGYQPGSYTVSVGIAYTETIVRVVGKKKHRTRTIVVSRTLKAHFAVC